MQWSFKIGSIFGIPIRVHFTFLILFLLPGRGGAVLTASIFACVILHELGHSLVARRYGIPVDSITLLPIGGVASMKGLPRSARSEFMMAIAGPAVSVGLAGLLALAATELYGPPVWHLLRYGSGNLPLLAELAVINLFLACFNLIPAFPMDGGRVFRAALWSRIGFFKATTIASALGKILAVICILVAFKFDFWLVLIALFIYSGADAEGKAAEWVKAISTLTVSKAMRTDFKTIRPENTIEQVAQLGSQCDQDFFPVLEQNQPVGLLTGDSIARALQDQKSDRPASDFMTKELIYCRPVDMLASIVQAIDKRNLPGILVMDEDNLVGLISSKNLTIRND